MRFNLVILVRVGSFPNNIFLGDEATEGAA